MATEPERDIEKMLAAYAEERRKRAGAPFTPHPATRAVLQGEVARRLAKSAGNRQPSARWISRWWPRLALAAGVVALVAVLLPRSLPLRTREAARLASNRTALAPELSAPAPAPAVREPPASSPPLTPAATPPPGGSAPVNVSPSSTRYRAAPVVASAPGPAPVMPATAPAEAKPVPNPPPGSVAAETVVVRNPVRSDRAAPLVASAPMVAPVTPVTAPNPTSPLALERGERALGVAARPGNSQMPAPMLGGGRANPVADGFFNPGLPELTQTQQFSFLALATDGAVLSSPAMKGTSDGAGVLSSFRLEQAGDRLRIIDADGSSYIGTIGQRDVPAGESARRTAAPAVAPGGSASAVSPAYYFRVEGTNQSLRQLVRFSGELVPKLPARPAGAVGRAGAPLPGTNAFLQQFQLQGRARIGNIREIQINAAPDLR